jgi:hypothetical protein
MPISEKNLYGEIYNSTSSILVTLLAFYMVEVITMIFTGHLGDSAIIAGSGLGSMYIIFHIKLFFIGF